MRRHHLLLVALALAAIVALLASDALPTWLMGGDEAGLDAREGDTQRGRASRGAPAFPSMVTGGEHACDPHATASGGTARLRGRVFDARDDAAIAGAQIAALRLEEEFKEVVSRRLTTSADDGSFALDDLEAGAWVVLPLHPSYVNPLLDALRTPSGDREALHAFVQSDGFWGLAGRHGLTVSISDQAESPHRLDIGLRPGPLLRGRVLGPSDRPMPSIDVHAHRSGDSLLPLVLDGAAFWLQDLPIARTDADGRFELRCLATYTTATRLGARHERLIGSWSAPIAEETGEVVLRLVEPARLSGRVIAPAGVPDDHVVVTAHSPSHTEWVYPGRSTWWPPWVRTGEGGRFELRAVPPEEVVVVAECDGCTGRTELGLLAPGAHVQDIVVRLDRDGRIHGVLVDAAGEPLPNEDLELRAKEHPGLRHLFGASASTDEAGRFRLAGELEASNSLWLVTGSREERLAEGIKPPALDLRMVAAPTTRATLHVRVTGPDGALVPRFELDSDAAAGLPVTGESGTAEVELFGEPPYAFTIVEPKDREGEPLALAPHWGRLERVPSAPLEVRIGTHATYRGRIVDHKGAPVPDVRMHIAESEHADEREIPVDETGEFQFTARSADTRDIGRVRLVLPPRHRELTSPAPLRPAVYEEVVVRSEGPSLAGRVTITGVDRVDLSGLEIDLEWGQSLFGYSEEEDESTVAVTAHDGSFVAHALPPGTRVRLTPRYGQALDRGLVVEGPPPLVMTGRDDVTIRLRPALEIEGRARGPGLAALREGSAQCGLLTWTGELRTTRLVTTPTADDDRFSIGGLTPGTYRVIVVSSEGRLLGMSAPVEAGARGVDLVLHACTGAITGTIAGFDQLDGPPSITVRLHGTPSYAFQVNSDYEGRFRIDQLDARQTYALTFEGRRSGAVVGAHVSGIRPGTSLTSPRLAPARTIRGRVEAREQGHPAFAVIARQGAFWWGGRIGLDGTFQVSVYDDGPFELAIHGQDFEQGPAISGVAAGAEDVVLVNVPKASASR